MIFFSLAATIAVSFFITGALRRYALACAMVDVPNPRSSHHVATPRGGGAAIAVTFIAALAIGGAVHDFPRWFLLSAGGLSVLVALIGFMDDRRHVAPAVRLVLHGIASGGAVALFYQAHDLSAVLPGLPDWLSGTLAVLSIVWLLNLYNFMDGIDGIAGIEAITACFGGALILAATGSELWLAPVLLLGSVAGFLFWNFPAARIFMGDVGSGFLGFVFGAFCLHAASVSAETFWGWIILLGAFIVDATVALFRRLARGRRIYVAHHSHAYQHAARKYGAHAPVSLAVGAINLLWLLPIALLVATSTLDWSIGLTIAWLPLLYLAIRFRSGVGEKLAVSGVRS